MNSPINQPPKLPSDSYGPTTFLLWIVFFILLPICITGVLIEKSLFPLSLPGLLLFYLLTRKR